MSAGRRRRFGHNLRSLIRWRNADADVREEMALHADLRTTELEALGVPPAEARRRAEREVGGTDTIVAAVVPLAAATDRASALGQRAAEFGHDLRHAGRLFRRSPGFSVVAVLTIALGLGANAAIFTLVNTLFFRPLPFDPEGNLVRVREFRQAPDGTRNNVDASSRTAEAAAQRRDLFTSSVAMVGTTRALLRDDGPIHLQGTRVGPGYTTVAGVAPVIGRTFTPDEERTAAPVVLISHRVWRTLFDGRLSAIGERVRLDDRSYEIVGVLPAAFHIPYDSEVWFPSRFAEDERSVFILARLAPGVTLEQAIAGLEPDGQRLNQAFPDQMRGMGITAVGARDYFLQNDHRVALALMGTVGVLLLIGCANVALLLTTRFASRRREVAVRAALGCGRGRQIRQFVTEALLLFSLGGALGLVLAVGLKDTLAVFLPAPLATQVGMESMPVDATVVFFAGVLSVAAGVGFGLIAALRATRADLSSVMKDAGRSLAGDRSRSTLRGLASAEIALALLLLTAAGMMVETFSRLQRRDLGFEPSGVLTLQAGTESQRYADGAQRLAFADQLLERIRMMPGVQAAAMTSVNPLCCGDWGMRASVEGIPVATQQDLPIFQHQLVTVGFFDTMRIPIVRGRAFTPEDRTGREPVVIVDERAARRFWPGQDPIGKRVKRGMPDGPQPWFTVIGVAGTIEDRGEYTEAWYLPLAQHPAGPSSATLHLMVRAPDPTVIVPAIKTASAALDPTLALHDITTMDAVRSERLLQSRMGAIVTAIFAAAGALLAGLGLYAVLSFVLAGDTREIGVRLALGATRARVAAYVVARGLRLAGWGILAGVPLAALMSTGIQELVPESRFNTATIVVAGAALVIAALFATAIPAIRALRLNPLDAMRAD